MEYLHRDNVSLNRKRKLKMFRITESQIKNKYIGEGKEFREK